MEEEGIPPQLVTLIQTLESPAPVDSFTEGLPPVEVTIYSSTGSTNVTITGLAPFHTIEDLQRALWLQQEKRPELFPKYTFLAIKDEDGNFQSVEGIFQEINEQEVHLPNPIDVFQNRMIQTEFVYPNGTKKPVGYFPNGRMTIEQKLLNGSSNVPMLHCFPFQMLRNKYFSAVPGTTLIQELHWYGIFYPYFPMIQNHQETGAFTAEDVKQAKRIETYIEAKLDQVQLLNTLVEEFGESFKELRTTESKFISFQWTTPKPSELDGVDTVFFQAEVNENRPYMRLLTPNATPITKLYQPNPLALPSVSDASLLGTWTKEPSPISNESFMFTKVVVRKEEYTKPALFGTLRLGDDGTADFVVQPARGVQSLSMRGDLFHLGTAIKYAVEDLPFLRLDEVKLGRANISIDYQLNQTQLTKDFGKKLADRLTNLSTVFQQITPPSDEKQTPVLALRYKGVSNFVSEDRISAYITYKINRQTPIHALPEILIHEFNLTEEEAREYIEKHLLEKGKFTIADPDTREFLALSNPGIDLAIYKKNINTYSVQLYNTQAISPIDIQRVTTALSCVLFLKDDQWEYALGNDVEESAKQMTVVQQAEQTIQKGALQEEEGVETGNLNLDLDLEEEAPAATKGVPEQGTTTKPTSAIPASTEKIISSEWFMTQLKKMDPELFAWKPDAGHKNPYSKQCMANVDRQPSVYDQTQYQLMRTIYAQDEATGQVGFIEYGVPNTRDTPQAAKGKVELFRVLRYGSDPMNLLYFMCAPIFCLRDRLPILKRDWISEQDREGSSKPKKSCPFCHGTQIENKDNPGVGETVIVRANLPKSTKPATFIGFLGENKHPKEGYYMPCCFSTEDKSLAGEYMFKRIYDATKKPPSVEERAIQEQVEEVYQKDAEIQSALQLRVQQVVNYELLSLRFAKEHVLGSEKYPLEPGKIGLPCVALDKYFGQSSMDMVTPIGGNKHFKPSAHGLFRLGVMGRQIKSQTNLFAALAPALNVNTPAEVAQLFRYAITPRVFSALNFGNLVNEFFSPVDSAWNDMSIQTWASDHLGTYHPKSEPELKRLKRAYDRFIEYIEDDTQPKQLRHFIHALAEPNLIFPAKGRDIGLTVVVLEYTTGDPSDAKYPTDIRVNCPIMGLDASRYANNAITFLTTNGKGLWEPLVFVDSLSDKAIVHRKKEAYYQITPIQMNQRTFPVMIRERVMEFLTQCRSSYRGAYTFQQGVDPRYLIPVSRMFELIRPLTPTGFVRDTYNHLVAITVSANPEKKTATYQILVPVADDGNIFRNRDLTVYLGIQSIPLASPNDYYNFYTSAIGLRLAELSNVYSIDRFLKGLRVFAVRLGSPTSPVKIVLPTSTRKIGMDTEIPSEIIEVTGKKSVQLEYAINRKIMFHSDEQESLVETAFIMKQQQIEDIYQQLRLSFSNWIATHPRGGEMRQFVETLLDRHDLPNFEKMRRLEIEFTSTIENMFYQDDDQYSVGTVLLRKDCIAIEHEQQCGSTCKWVEGTSPRCKIHTPRLLRYTQDEEETNSDSDSSSNQDSHQSAVRYFTLRLFDECLRIPARRHELFTRKIKRVQVPKTNIHMGDQWIIPENVPAWYDLLLASTKKTQKEEPQFWEEYSRTHTTEEEQDTLYDTIHIHPLPKTLAEFFNPGAADRIGLQVIGQADDPSRAKTLLRFYGIEKDPDVPDRLDDATLRALSSNLKQPVVQLLMGQVPVLVQGATTWIMSPQMFTMTILVPDYPEGAAIVKMLVDDSDSIPSNLFPSTVFQQAVKFGQRRLVRRKEAPTPPVVESSSNSNSSSEESAPAPPSVKTKTVRRVRLLSEQPITTITPSINTNTSSNNEMPGLSTVENLGMENVD